jgi:hypothetical protein
MLTIDHADVVVSLGDLLRRTFHATRVRSSGFAIRARLRLDRMDTTPALAAALPPIEGFADPPLLDVGPEPPPLTDANYNLWTIHLEDVDVEHVREVWIENVRAVGDTHVAGRWLFRPMRSIDVGPATVEANGVDFSYGDVPLATDVRGSLRATVHPFDVRQVDGLEFLDHVSYDGRLGGHAMVADMLRSLLPRSGVRFTRWEAPFDAHLILDHGTLVDGTRVSVDSTDCEIEAGGLTFRAPIRTDLGVDGDLGTLATRVSDLRVSGADAQQAHAASIAVDVTSRRLRIARPAGDARFILDVDGAGTNDVGAWQRYLPATSAAVVRSGTWTATVHADGSLVEGGGWAAGRATVAADDLVVALGSAVVTGSLSAHVDLVRGTSADRLVDLSGSDVVVHALSARPASSDIAMLGAPSLTVTAARLTLGPSGVDGHVSLDVPRADLLRLEGVRELVPLPAGLAIETGRGRARLHVDANLGTGSLQGEGEAALRGLRARAGSTELFGDLDCSVRAHRSGDADGSTDLSGTTLAVTRAGTGKAASLENAWWGRATLSRATLRTRKGVRFDARVHVSAKDASPATALVSQNTTVPGWAADIFRMPVLDADAQVQVSPSSVAVRSLVAHGGKSSVRAEYTKVEGRQDGAVLLGLGWMDLGYDLASGSTGLVLVGPDAWYGRKVAALRDAAAAAKRKADTADQVARYAAMTPRLRSDEARTLAAACALEARSCDGTSIESLLRTGADERERSTLSGIAYAPMVVAAAQGGKDGATLDPFVLGSVAEALRVGGESALDDIPFVARLAPATDPDAARGKVISATGRVASIRREGAISAGTLTTDGGPVYFVTPFATSAVPGDLERFRGVFVQRYAPAGSQDPPSLVLVGAFGRADGPALATTPGAGRRTP